jgi:hypothetical protein
MEVMTISALDRDEGLGMSTALFVSQGVSTALFVMFGQIIPDWTRPLVSHQLLLQLIYEWLRKSHGVAQPRGNPRQCVLQVDKRRHPVLSAVFPQLCWPCKMAHHAHD